MLIYHTSKAYEDPRLSAADRGYKASGKKLLPRSSYEASLGGSASERQREFAKALAHQLKVKDDGYQLRLYRAANHVPTRHRRMLEILVRETEFYDQELVQLSSKMLLDRGCPRLAAYWRAMWDDRLTER